MTAPTVILPPHHDAREPPYSLVREDKRRALRARLQRAVEELEACRRRAIEIGDLESAERVRVGIGVLRGGEVEVER